MYLYLFKKFWKSLYYQLIWFHSVSNRSNSFWIFVVDGITTADRTSINRLVNDVEIMVHFLCYTLMILIEVFIVYSCSPWKFHGETSKTRFFCCNEVFKLDILNYRRVCNHPEKIHTLTCNVFVGLQDLSHLVQVRDCCNVFNSVA